MTSPRPRAATTARAGNRVLSVDWRLCAGHGVCAAAVPEMVALDRWGYPDLGGRDSAPVPDDLRAAASWAVAACPAAALSLRRAPA